MKMKKNNMNKKTMNSEIHTPLKGAEKDLMEKHTDMVVETIKEVLKDLPRTIHYGNYAINVLASSVVTIALSSIKPELDDEFVNYFAEGLKLDLKANRKALNEK